MAIASVMDTHEISGMIAEGVCIDRVKGSGLAAMCH